MNGDFLFVLFEKPINSSIFGGLIEWLIGISSVAVGIILFTILLKLVTLPFDFMSRASMRKNSLKMEEMRPELEKLQKQYANDKALYNQKMMALYKKNGYSMFGACLPTIVTLVIFILAINGFTSYSQFKNKEYFYDMSVSYNSVYYSGMDVDNDYIKKGENGELIFDRQKLFDLTENVSVGTVKTEPLQNANNEDFEIFVKKCENPRLDNSGVDRYFEISTTNSYVYVRSFYNLLENGKIDLEEKVTNEYYLVSDYYDKITNGKLAENLKDTDGNVFTPTTTTEEEKKAEAIAFLKKVAEKRSADSYHSVSGNFRFLWVKNVWVPDSPLAYPIPQKLGKDATASAGCGCGGQDATFVSSYGNGNEIKNVNEEQYSSLINGLKDETSTANGYFILAVLTAVISFLSQFIITKSQKAQMELQTVNGQGAQTQKMMMWIMPIMMAFFAFMYTASFSIYIILSSVLSIANTLIINKIVDRKYKNKKKNPKNDNKTRSRIYVSKEVEKSDDKKAKDGQPVQDFVAMPEQKKPRIRGRLK